MKDPAIIIGGNCSIQAFDCKGNEILWTVTGDNVRSIIVMDIDLDGSNEVNIINDLFLPCTNKSNNYLKKSQITMVLISINVLVYYCYNMLLFII